MPDRGLQEAIRAAGGVTELARRIGISQPSVSNWSRIPAERVLTVEAVTGVARAILRPDLYDENNTTNGVDEVDLARAQEYALLAALLTRAPDAAFLQRLATLRGDPTPLGVAHVGARRRGGQRRRQQSRARIFRSVHRHRPRRIDALRLLLHRRLPARATAGAAARGFGRARHRARRGAIRVGRSRRHPVRDHVRHCRRTIPGASGRRPATVRKAPGALDRTFLRRPGARRERAISTGASARSAGVFIDIESEAFALAE